MNGLRGITFLLLMQTLGELIARGLGLPLPGPVIGLLLLGPCLYLAPVRQWIAPAAGFLLAHLSLLFVPVGVGVIAHLDLLAHQAGRVALVILISTWVGLAVTAWVMRGLLRREARDQGAAIRRDGDSR
jgi:holin-like protein